MKPAFSQMDFSSVEWGWSFWLIVLLPAIVAFSAGLYSGATKRPVRAQLLLIFVHVLCLSLLFYGLWTFHIERIDQAKVDYFMKHENSPTFSWSESPRDEPVYSDWTTTGNKGFYIQERNEDGVSYIRPPYWVLLVAPVYCITFWVIGFFVAVYSTRSRT